MIQNILDPNGNIIGTLELPDTTPTEAWTQALQLYSSIPSLPIYSIAQIISGTIVAIVNTSNNILDPTVLALFNTLAQTGQVCDYVIRIDNIFPEPQVGWSYNGTTFSAPSS